MRRVSSLLVPVFLSLLAAPLAADQVVLRDGRTLETKKPPVIKGRQAILTLADGKLVSIPAAEIDAEKTAAAAKKAAEAKAAPPPPPAAAPTLVEAARATQAARKASVVLTDQDVARGWAEGAMSEEEKGDAEVVVGAVTTKQDGPAYSIEGSVQNTGKETALGVVVTIEAFAGEGKPVATAFGTLAKDDLEPGEKAEFRARIETDKAVTRFTYLPRWKAPVRAPEDSAARDAQKPAAGAGEEGARPAPTPEPTPEPPPQRNPDYAAPPANAPVGAPAQPGGTYLPPPSSDQPKPPGGGL